MSDGSTVELEVAGTDLASLSTIAELTADVAANANPSLLEASLKDVQRELAFTAGDRVRLKIDGQALWGGYLLNIGRSNFFPAGDGKEDTKSRKWRLRAVDSNILLDKRVLRRPANYLKAIPNITVDRQDGSLIRQMLTDYVDWPAGFDGTTFIDDVRVPAQAHITTTKPWAWMQQGTRIRDQFEDFSRWSGAIYYIGPDDAAHYHALQTVECPWGFSDRPNRAPLDPMGSGFQGAYYGFRELDADEDGSEFATDAFVWGGGAPQTTAAVFHRATDATLEAQHEKWQYSETHFNETNFKTQENVTIRANMIVFGNPTGTGGGSEPGSVVGEGPRGLRFPQWSYSFAWFARDVPFMGATRRHVYPGDMVPIQLWAYSQDGGMTPFSKFLPLRQLRITFPGGASDGKAHVRFEGMFDLRNDDPFTLWKFLRQRTGKVAQTVLGVVTDASDQSQYGDFGQFVPTPAPNGATTVFAVKFGYIPTTTKVYLNGLLQTRGVHYTESNPEAGEITFVSAPLSTDTIFVECRTLAG